MKETAETILRFWFEELTEADWFSKNDELDEMIRHRFISCLHMARRGELFSWRESPAGRLAEILVLDQFSRNIYRGRPESFQNDSMALILAQEMIFHKLDMELEPQKRSFAYMPLMHSESKIIHETALELFRTLNNSDNLKYELLHKEIIDRFGRYPHRNKILERPSTPEEAEFLKLNPGF